MRNFDRVTFKEDVRRANALEEVIPALTSAHLVGMGAERRTLCPFHEDRHPSLRVNEERQQWFCDVCRTGGDVFAFVMKHRECRFPDALAWLAARAGLSRVSR